MACGCGPVRRLDGDDTSPDLALVTPSKAMASHSARVAYFPPMDRVAAREWIERHVRPVGPIEVTHERRWSTVLRVPLAKSVAWFKACSSLQAFEPPLTAELSARWPDRVPEVLAFDDNRGWLLMADAGVRIGELGNRPEYWIRILPLYAELQRGEVAHTPEHLGRGVPDLRVETLPARYYELLGQDPALGSDDREKLRAFGPRFHRLCGELSSQPIPETIQHDDLHMNNVYAQGQRLRVLDWGDSSVSHPFGSLVATFRFLEERNGITEGDPWRARIRDAYLEPWGSGLSQVFDLAQRVCTFAHAIAPMRQRASLAGPARVHFDQDLAIRLRRALARVIT